MYFFVSDELLLCFSIIQKEKGAFLSNYFITHLFSPNLNCNLCVKKWQGYEISHR